GWRISGNGDTELNELDLRGDAQSDNYVAGTSGWFLGVDGTLEVNDGVFRGTLAAANGTFSGTLVGADGTFTGTISGNQIIGGTITGVTFRTAASGTRIQIAGTTIQFYSGSSLVASLDPSGFSIGGDTIFHGVDMQ